MVGFDDSYGSRLRLTLSRRHRALSALLIFSVGIRTGYLSVTSVDILIESDSRESGRDFLGGRLGVGSSPRRNAPGYLSGDLVARLPPLATDGIAHPK
jgi:hypothetical protein